MFPTPRAFYQAIAVLLCLRRTAELHPRRLLIPGVARVVLVLRPERYRVDPLAVGDEAKEILLSVWCVKDSRATWNSSTAVVPSAIQPKTGIEGATAEAADAPYRT